MLPGGIYSVGYGKDMALIRTHLQWALLIMGLVLLFVCPLFLKAYLIALANYIAIAAIAALGLNIVCGYCGQISMGHAAFIALGAYSSGILATKGGLPFWIALPCSGIIAALVGLLFGLVSLRISGLYLAMATLAAHFLIMWTILHLPTLTGGLHGVFLPSASLGSFAFNSDYRCYFLIMAIFVIMMFFAKNLSRTRAGRAFIAIRDNEQAAGMMGINTFVYKLLAFAIASFYAGVAGSLWAYWLTAINVEQFPFMDSIWYLGMLIVGGWGTTLGPILGAVIFKLLFELSVSVGPKLALMFPAIGGQFLFALSFMLPSLVLIVFLIFEPRGLAHRWEMFKASYRLWPFSR